MNIRIITDSASDLMLPARSDLTVIPMRVMFGEHEYLDGVELSHRQFYELLIEGETLPTTSQISPEQFENKFSKAAEANEQVIVITISSKLSGTFQSANIAAEKYRDRVHIIDSKNVTIGEGILVRRALQLVDEGLEAAAIAEKLEKEKKRIKLIALLDTLEYLKRGGRLSASAAMMGNLLSIKPVVAVEDGEVKVLGKARGSKNGSNLLIEEIGKTPGIDFERPYCLGYTGLSDGLLQKYIIDSAALWHGKVGHLPISTVGGTIGTHVGPGAIAVTFFHKEETE